MRVQLGLTAFAIGIPLLAAWTKIRIWDWLANRVG